MTERTLPPSSDAALAARIRDARAAIEHADQHPDFEMLAALVDDTVPALEAGIVRAHVADCPVCTEDVQDLNQARAQLSGWVGPSSRGARSSSRRLVYWAAAAVITVAAAGLAWWAMRASPAAPQPVAEQARVPERPSAPAEPAPIIVNDGGTRLSIASDGTVAGLDQLASGDAGLVGQLLKTGHLPIAPMLRSVRSTAGALMGGPIEPAGFSVLGPIGTLIAIDRPVFRWAALTGATSYVVSVFDISLNPVATSGPITSDRWTPPAPLPRGVVLVWQVEATTAQGPVLAPKAGSPEARFSVLTDLDALALERGRVQAGSSHLALAALYSRLGLVDEAQHELDVLARDNPGSTVVADLIEQLKAGR